MFSSFSSPFCSVFWDSVLFIFVGFSSPRSLVCFVLSRKSQFTEGKHVQSSQEEEGEGKNGFVLFFFRLFFGSFLCIFFAVVLPHFFLLFCCWQVSKLFC